MDYGAEYWELMLQHKGTYKHYQRDMQWFAKKREVGLPVQ